MGDLDPGDYVQLTGDSQTRSAPDHSVPAHTGDGGTPLGSEADVYNHIQIMSMQNVQITVDEELLREVDRVAEPMGLKRSEIVRRALRLWLQRRAIERFEEDWIKALGDRPDEPGRADDWRPVQTWSRK